MATVLSKLTGVVVHRSGDARVAKGVPYLRPGKYTRGSEAITDSQRMAESIN
jgi:hypothetical protein